MNETVLARARRMRALVLSLAVLALVSACARTVVLDDCNFQPVLFAHTADPQDLRFYVLATPPVRDAANPSIDVASNHPDSESRHYHLSLDRLESSDNMKTFYGAVDADLWRRYRLSTGSNDEFRRLQTDIAAQSNTTVRFRLSASVIRSSQSNVREVRIRNDSTGREEMICRL